MVYETWVTNFSPLIQALVGIGLVLYFEEVFNFKPVEKIYNLLLLPLIERFNLLYQRPKLYWADASNLFESRKEQYYKNCIILFRKIAVLTIVYCVFLLAYAGFENYIIKHHWFFGLIPVMVCFCVHVIFIRYHSNNWSIILLCTALWGGVFCWFAKSKCWGLIDPKYYDWILLSTVVLTLSYFVLMLFFILWQILKIFIFAYCFKWSFEKYDKQMNYFVNFFIVKTTQDRKTNRKLINKLDQQYGKFHRENENADHNKFMMKIDLEYQKSTEKLICMFF